MFFHKKNPKMSFKVAPKIVKMVSRRVFCGTEKTLNSASAFFLPFAVSGTPGPSIIVKIRCKYHNFRDATLSQKNIHFFTKMCQNCSPRRPQKALEITNNSFGRLLKTMSFFATFFSVICCKMTPFSGRAWHRFRGMLGFFFTVAPTGKLWQFVDILHDLLWYCWRVFLQLLVLWTNPECKNYWVRRWTAAGVFNIIYNRYGIIIA